MIKARAIVNLKFKHELSYGTRKAFTFRRAMFWKTIESNVHRRWLAEFRWFICQCILFHVDLRCVSCLASISQPIV